MGRVKCFLEMELFKIFYENCKSKILNINFFFKKFFVSFLCFFVLILGVFKEGMFLVILLNKYFIFIFLNKG